MLEIFFVIGFFIMLLLTGISILGVLAALVVGTFLMMFAGLFLMAIKLLPWLLLAIVVVWIWRTIQRPPLRRY